MTNLTIEMANTVLNARSPYLGVMMKQHLGQNPNSKVRERKNVFLSFCQTFNHRKVNQITPTEPQNWFKSFQLKTGCSERNLRSLKPLINHFFKFLVSEGHLISNPLEKVRFNPTPMTRNRIILSETEVSESLELLKLESPLVIYSLIFCIAHTGARRDEIRALKWDSVDFNTKLIHLNFTKNGDRRSIRMSDPLFEMLKQLPKINEWGFLNQFGRQVSATQIDDTLIRLQKKYLHIKKWRCDDLRHSFAYNVLKREGQMYQLQAILGHRSITMTIDLYDQLQAVDVEPFNLYDFKA